MRLVIQGLRLKGHKKTLETIELFFIGILLIGSILVYEFGKEKPKSSVSIKELMKESFSESLIGAYFPVMTAKGMAENERGGFLQEMLSFVMPLYGYMQLEGVNAFVVKDTPELYKEYETTEEIEDNRREAYVIEDVPEDLLSLLQTENGFQNMSESDFTKNEQKVATINLSDFETTEDFIKTFYTVDSVTKAVPELFDMEVLSSMDMTLKQGNDMPQILIYHTHSQEGFVDSALGNSDTTIVGAGELLSRILREEYGYNVLHHTGEYDVPSRDYAYSKSLPALEQILKENPSIEVVIDLHRDGVNEGTHLVTDLNGRQTAKIMFFNGLSRTKKGPIGYLENPNLQENLAFSFQMCKAANEYYPGLTRKNYLNGYRYNMHLRGKSLLVELGAQTNTVEEIKNAIEPLAHILDIVLSGDNT